MVRIAGEHAWHPFVKILIRFSKSSIILSFLKQLS
ncbi:MAG: hypothetical protein JWO94_176 [Verrucomicrobiaceae bacterium]|nr:hypothetical protein [Verrucomicrobiaceae bacterium]